MVNLMLSTYRLSQKMKSNSIKTLSRCYWLCITILFLTNSSAALSANPLNITPATTLSYLKERYTLEAISGIDTGLPIYLIKGHDLKGQVAVNFINHRQYLSITFKRNCQFDVPDDDLLYAAMVQFFPASKPKKSALIARHGKGYTEKVDENYVRYLEWQDQNIQAYFYNDTDYIKSISYRFTNKEVEDASTIKAAWGLICALQGESK